MTTDVPTQPSVPVRPATSVRPQPDVLHLRIHRTHQEWHNAPAAPKIWGSRNMPRQSLLLLHALPRSPAPAPRGLEALMRILHPFTRLFKVGAPRKCRHQYWLVYERCSLSQALCENSTLLTCAQARADRLQRSDGQGSNLALLSPIPIQYNPTSRIHC